MPEQHPDAELAALGSAAVDSVKNAIGRGRKRRSGRRGVASGEIEVGRASTGDPSQLVDPNKQSQNISYHKRRRTSLIPENDGEVDADSNDEWEEHVELDEKAVEAAVALSKNDAAHDQASRPGSSNSKRDEEGAQSKASDELEANKEPTEADIKAENRIRAAAERKKVMRQHSIHIALLVAHLLRLDAAAQSEEVRAFALSITPDDTFLSAAKGEELLARLALWARAAFRPYALFQSPTGSKTPTSLKRSCSAEERAIRVAQTEAGDIMDVAAVLASSIRTQGFRCRIVSALQPMSHQAPKLTKTIHRVTGRVQLVNDGQRGGGDSVLYAWLEIWLPSSMKWIPFDIFAGTTCEESPSDTLLKSIAYIEEYSATSGKSEASTRKGSTTTRSRRKQRAEISPLRKVHVSMFSHVAAVENGLVTDVTRRYTRDWSDVDKMRAKGKTFEKVLKNLGADRNDLPTDEAHEHEAAEFDSLAAGEAMPTSLSALQKHPRYVLERHLKKYETIYPKEPIVGYLKEEPIFLRSHVHLLHTKDRWIRQLREVSDDAVAVKSVKSKNGTDDTVDLFGAWQTHPLVIPECVDGKVPRSVHGNVDLWTPDHLPKGTVHVNMQFARTAARKLGIDCAPAMTGFDIRAGRSVPKIEGIVVAQEFADLVRDAARNSAAAAAKRAEEKARQDACDRWRKLLRTMNAREKVKKRYGGMIGDVGSYEANQKREGLRRAREEKEGRSMAQTGDAIENSRKTKVSTSIVGTAEAHEHEFGPSQCLEGDTWVKRCSSCGIDVTFEKL